MTSVTPDLAVADWEVALDGAPGRPVYTDGQVLVGTDAGVLYALDAATGERSWSLSLDQSVRAGPIVADGVAYAVTGTYGLGGTPTAVGTPVDGGDPWRFTHDAPSGSRARLSLLGATADGVYLGTSDDVQEERGESLYALAPDGEHRWTGGIGDVRDGLVGGSGTYVTARGRVDAFGAGGERRWTLEADRPRLSALGDETVYVNAGTSGSGQYLQSLDAVTGARRWRFDPWRAHSTAAVDGTVYAGGDRLARLDPDTGDRIWTVERGHWLVGDPEPVADGAVYAGGTTVGAYAVDDGTRRWLLDGDAEFSRIVGTGEGAVVVSERDGPLRALSGTTGEQRWAYTEASGGPSVGSGRAFVPTSDSLFAAPL